MFAILLGEILRWSNKWLRWSKQDLRVVFQPDGHKFQTEFISFNINHAAVPLPDEWYGPTRIILPFSCKRQLFGRNSTFLKIDLRQVAWRRWTNSVSANGQPLSFWGLNFYFMVLWLNKNWINFISMAFAKVKQKKFFGAERLLRCLRHEELEVWETILGPLLTQLEGIFGKSVYSVNDTRMIHIASHCFSEQFAPQKKKVEDCFPFGMPFFQVRAVSFREG